jgi:hypothetical protein
MVTIMRHSPVTVLARRYREKGPAAASACPFVVSIDVKSPEGERSREACFIVRQTLSPNKQDILPNGKTGMVVSDLKNPTL